MKTEILGKLDSNQNDFMTKEEEEEVLKVILDITAKLEAINSEFHLGVSSLENNINAIPNQISLIIEQEFRAITSSINDIQESIEALPNQLSLVIEEEFRPLACSVNEIKDNTNQIA